jgi:hypothetical protein
MVRRFLLMNPGQTGNEGGGAQSLDLPTLVAISAFQIADGDGYVLEFEDPLDRNACGELLKIVFLLSGEAAGVQCKAGAHMAYVLLEEGDDDRSVLQALQRHFSPVIAHTATGTLTHARNTFELVLKVLGWEDIAAYSQEADDLVTKLKDIPRATKVSVVNNEFIVTFDGPPPTDERAFFRELRTSCNVQITLVQFQGRVIASYLT